MSYLDTLEAEAQPKEIPEEEVSAQQGPPPMEEMPAKESETEAATAEVPDDRVVAEESPEEEAATEVPTPTVAVASAVVETDEPTQAVVETFSAASAVTPSEMQPSVASASVYQQARTIHPCPTCGRELTYIALYRRWYCYHCRAYAPVSTSPVDRAVRTLVVRRLPTICTGGPPEAGGGSGERLRRRRTAGGASRHALDRNGRPPAPKSRKRD